MSAGRILVVEDNDLTRKMVRVALEKCGYEVREAGDGATALERLQQFRPELIIQDLHLPDIDGVELVRQLRARPAGEGIAIIAFSGLMSRMEEAAALRAGFTDYLFKPVEPSRLIALVNAYLSGDNVLATQPGRGFHVLLVDDDPLQGKLNARQLQDRGFEVTLVQDGATALTAARHGPPDVIVTDLLMPGMTGMELCLAVRRDSGLARIPVVITSSTFALIEEIDLKLAAEIGADAFVERTPSFAEVASKVSEVLAGPGANVPGPQADALSSAFAGRLMRQLEHHAAINASLVRQAGMQSALLSIMAGAADILTKENDLPTLLQSVLARALDAGGVSAGAIFLLDDSGDPILRAQIGFPEATVDSVADFFGERDLLRTFAALEHAIEIPSESIPAERSRTLLARAQTASMVVAPLLTRGRSLGVLALQASSRELGASFLASVSALASQLAQACALSQLMTSLSASEERYRSLFEGIPTGVFRSTRDGTILDVNQELVRILGLTDRAELVGKPAYEFYVHRSDRARWGEQLAQGHEVREFEVEMCRADGSTFWGAISARAIHGAANEVRWYEGTISDVSARKTAEAALLATQSRLAHLLSSSDAVIYLLRLTADGIVPEWISENSRRVTGHQDGDLLQFDWWKANVHPDDVANVLEVTRALPRTEQATQEYRFRRPDGQYIWLRDSQRLLRDATGQPTQVVGTWLDITQTRLLEAQLVQAQKMEAIGQLAAGVAHDFNNILTVISGFAEMLAEDLPREHPSHHQLEEIVRAGAKAGMLTRQLLAFGRRQLLQPINLELGQAVSASSAMVARLIGEHITVTVSPSEKPLFVRLDPGQLEQVIMNLAVNARDAMEHGGRLTFETQETLRQETEPGLGDLPPGRYATLIVSDTGAGMTSEVRDHIFEPFFTTKGLGKGTGLGLATVYGIVKQSGGSIMVESEPGRGTTFRIYVPLRGGDDAPMPNHVTATDATAPGHGEVILLVEDEDAVREFAAAVLSRRGYRILEAGNAEEAMALAAEPARRIDLLLTDVIMPGLTGPALHQALHATRPDLPVVFMSGYAGDAARRHGTPVSAGILLEKPFSTARLLEAIATALRKGPADA